MIDWWWFIRFFYFQKSFSNFKPRIHSNRVRYKINVNIIPWVLLICPLLNCTSGRVLVLLVLVPYFVYFYVLFIVLPSRKGTKRFDIDIDIDVDIVFLFVFVNDVSWFLALNENVARCCSTNRWGSLASDSYAGWSCGGLSPRLVALGTAGPAAKVAITKRRWLRCAIMPHRRVVGIVRVVALRADHRKRMRVRMRSMVIAIGSSQSSIGSFRTQHEIHFGFVAGYSAIRFRWRSQLLRFLRF